MAKDDDRDRLRTLLIEAKKAAAKIGQPDLARVLHALVVAVVKDDMSVLEQKGTMLSAARSYTSRPGIAGAGSTRPEVIRYIARRFSPPPRTEKKARLIALDCARALQRMGAEVVLGEPHPQARERISTQCRTVFGRDTSLIKTKAGITKPVQKWTRTPADYARAVLRGWGLSAAEAKDWTKGIE